jgi:hypothetical protein
VTGVAGPPAQRRPPGDSATIPRISSPRWAIAAIVLATFALALSGLGHKSLWIDEADSVYFAQHAWGDLIWRLCDPHPPGYYALLKAFIALGGKSETAVRLPSALAATLAVAALARLTRELANGTLARTDGGTGIALQPPMGTGPGTFRWLPAALLALAPLHIWYAQEARMYALVTLLGLGAAICAVRLARRRHWSDAAGYAVIAAAATLTDQSALPVLLGIALLWLHVTRGRARSERRRWLVLQVAAGLPFLLWWRQAETFRAVSASALYPVTMVRLMVEDTWMLLRRDPWIVLVVAGVAVAVAVAFLLVTKLSAQSRKPTRTMRGISPAWGIVALYGLGTLFSVVPRLYTLKRLTVPLLPYALIVVAWALTRLNIRRVQLVAILAASLGASLLNIWWVPKAPWREAVAAIDARILPGDIVWVEELAIPVFDTYYSGDAPRRIWRIGELDAVAASSSAAQRLWLVTQVTRLRYLLELYPNLDQAGLVWSGVWPGIEARAYDPTQLLPGALIPQVEIPTWMRDLPSPLDEACRAP